jgi:protocatechuate 3,4-dioxygenase beta subunit
MRRIILAAILVAFTLPDFYAQTADKSAVAGTVTDALTEQPIAGAMVRLRGIGSSAGQSASTSTNAEGQFSVEGLTPGEYLVSASRSGYVNPRGIGASLPRQRVVMGEGQRIDDLKIRLAQEAMITGRITDGAGKPLRGVSVQAMKRSYRQGHNELADVSLISTNDAGEYRIVDLTRGEYYLRASYSHPPALKSQSDEAYVPLYYPGTNDPARSVALTVREGEQLAGIDMHIAPVHTFHVKGRAVNGMTALPAKGSRVTLVGDQGKLTFSPAQSATGATGTFEFRGIPPGAYILAAEQPATGPHGKALWGRMQVQVSDVNVEDVEAVVSPGAEIAGRVRAEGKAAVDLTRMSVELESRDPSAAALMADAPSAPVSADGTFLLHQVPEGSYELHIFAVPSGFYLTANGADVFESGITVGHGYAPPALDLILSLALGRIDGTVTNSDEQPQAGVPVLLVPNGVRRSQRPYYRRAITDQSGRFAMQKVAPGDYRLFAGYSMEMPDFLELDPTLPLDQGTAAHVENDSHLNVQLEEAGNR